MRGQSQFRMLRISLIKTNYIPVHALYPRVCRYKALVKLWPLEQRCALLGQCIYAVVALDLVLGYCLFSSASQRGSSEPATWSLCFSYLMVVFNYHWTKSSQF